MDAREQAAPSKKKYWPVVEELPWHAPSDRRAPPQTYKERSKLEAACAVPSCVILGYTATESSHCTEGKIRAALSLVG